MGIDAYVPCLCVVAGDYTLPPLPVIFDRWRPRPASGDRGSGYAAIREWSATACAHPRFWLVEGRLPRGTIRHFLAANGGDRACPTIVATMPDHNGGELLAAQARRCLAELDAFAATIAERYAMVALVDPADDTAVWVDLDDSLVSGPEFHQPPAGPSIFGFDREHRLHMDPPPPAGDAATTTWLDPDAVLRIRDLDGRTLFETTEFTQHLGPAVAVCRDVGSGREIAHWSPVLRDREDRTSAYPHLRAEVRPLDLDFAGFKLLRHLYTAAVESGNPVYWY